MTEAKSQVGGAPFTIRVKPLTSHFVLIDYDNLIKRVLGCASDLNYFITHIVANLDRASDFFEHASMMETVEMRLYGGWYEGKRLTKQAQDVQTEIRRILPVSYTTRNGAKILVRCELALSMLTIKGQSLFATSRVRNVAEEVEVPRLSCCEPAQEHFEYLRSAVLSGKCPLCGRNIIGRAFKKHCQKMVDAMLFCDCMHLALKSPDYRISVVSSDADMIPVLLQTSGQGSAIYHLLTEQMQANVFGEYYQNLFGRNYKQLTW